jgi:hypothetical protein
MNSATQTVWLRRLFTTFPTSSKPLVAAVKQRKGGFAMRALASFAVAAGAALITSNALAGWHKVNAGDCQSQFNYPGDNADGNWVIVGDRIFIAARASVSQFFFCPVPDTPYMPVADINGVLISGSGGNSSAVRGCIHSEHTRTSHGIRRGVLKPKRTSRVF